MKKHLLLPFLAFIALTVNGQNTVPNGNFESWTQGNLKYPENYPVSSNSGAFFLYNTSANVFQSTDAYHGSSALQLTTTISNHDTIFAYILNGQPNGDLSKWHGGMPYSQKPTGIRGYYKYNIATADSGAILLTFSKSGSNVGSYVFPIGGIHSTYTLFNFTLKPALTVTPDSMNLAAISCKFSGSNQQPTAKAEGSLFLDSLSLTGVTSQPAGLNGDFENWVSKPVYKPNNWLYQSGDQGDGLLRSTDPEAGSFALELKTFASNSDNGMRAQPAMVVTGSYSNACNCWKGGFPFTNQVDTFVFYYKYSSPSNDSAGINLNFIKNGNSIWWEGMNLHPSSSYQRIEFPFNTQSAPDSLMIMIQSSNYSDTSLTSVGSDLIIDEIQFKSHPTHTGFSLMPYHNGINIYPNPSTGILNVRDAGFNIRSLEIYNTQGKRVYTNTFLNHQSINEIDISNIEKGLYMIKVYGDNKVHTEKIVIQ